jgi:prophage DNA circulation protein
MAKAKFDIKIEATRPLYAGVGVADAAVEVVREYVADVQKKFAEVQKDVQTRVADVQKSVTTLELEPKALREQAVTVVNARVDALSKDAKARRAAIEARVAELQTEAKALPAKVQAAVTENVATVTDAYGDLAQRGEALVAKLRKQETAKAAAPTVKVAATSAPKKTTAKKAPAKKAAAKKAAPKASS